MRGPFNLSQLTGSRLADWKPTHAGTDGAAAGGCPDVITFGTPGGAPVPAASLPEEKTTMTFRSEIRAAVAAAGAIAYADLEKKFPERNIATPLSQMTNSKQLRRQGSGRDAIYTIGKAGEAKLDPPAGRAKTARKPRRVAVKRTGRRANGAASLPIVRGDPIAATIAELRNRREGIDQAIAVLEALA